MERSLSAVRGGDEFGLDEFKLRDELKALRALIPDQPSLNPIVNIAFDLSRRLEGGSISFADLKALAGRLMDRACVHRALRLKEQIGFVDDEVTREEFATFVAGTAGGAKDGASFEAFRARWEPAAQRHRVHGAPDLRALRGAFRAHGGDRGRGGTRE